MNKIYIFSGLGVDRRVFANIDFGDLNIEFIDWIEPFKSETFEGYAERMAKNLTAENPILIGLSFGGMLISEISKFLPTKKIILISSAKTKYELPRIYRFMGRLGLHKIIPNKFLTKYNFALGWFFGVKSKGEKLLLKQILKETNPKFLSWSINQIVQWKNTESPKITYISMEIMTTLFP